MSCSDHLRPSAPKTSPGRMYPARWCMFSAVRYETCENRIKTVCTLVFLAVDRQSDYKHQHIKKLFEQCRRIFVS